MHAHAAASPKPHLQLVPDSAAQARFDVSFARRGSSAFGLYGAGQIALGADAIVITGKRHRIFRTGAPVRQAIAQHDIFDAYADGARVFFDVWGGGRTAPLKVSFEAPDAAAARAILAALSMRQTHDFIKEQRERDQFVDQLDTVSKRAVVTPAIVGLNLLVFALMLANGAGLFTINPAVAVRWGSNLGPLTLSGQWWRLLTSTFIHFGLLHLAVNMIALIQAGPIVERLFGSLRFTLLYLCAALFGEMASLWWHPMTNGAGASGAIFGVFGGLLAFVLNPRNAVPPTVMASIRKTTVPIVFANLLFGFLYPRVDNAAHIGGLLAGLFMGYQLARPLARIPR